MKEHQIGNWEVTDTGRVVKLAVVFDEYRHREAPATWAIAETEALAKGTRFNPKDLFHEETKRVNREVVVFRYYTPSSNRREIFS